MTAGVNTIDDIVNVQAGTIVGDVTINYNSAYDLVLPVGLVITGNLTVDAPNATVNNHARIDGDLIIKDVSANTWNEYANMNRIVFNAEGKTLNIRGGVASLAINVNSNLVTRRQLKGVRVGAGVVVKVKATMGSTKSTTITGSGGQETITPPAVPVRETDAKHFTFNAETGTITGYKTSGEYADAPKDVIIPKKIGGVLVTGIGKHAFYQKKLTTVIIPSSVKHIGESAFELNQLTTVIIPPEAETIEKSAFEFNQLTTVIIPGSVKNIGDSAFRINALTTITISDGVETIGEDAFGNKYGAGGKMTGNNTLTTVTIPSTVEAIGDYAFRFNGPNRNSGSITGGSYSGIWNVVDNQWIKQ